MGLMYYFLFRHQRNCCPNSANFMKGAYTESIFKMLWAGLRPERARRRGNCGHTRQSICREVIVCSPILVHHTVRNPMKSKCFPGHCSVSKPRLISLEKWWFLVLVALHVSPHATDSEFVLILIQAEKLCTQQRKESKTPPGKKILSENLRLLLNYIQVCRRTAQCIGICCYFPNGHFLSVCSTTCLNTDFAHLRTHVDHITF